MTKQIDYFEFVSVGGLAVRRRLFALRKMRDAARDLGAQQLERRVAQAIEHDERVRRMRLERRAGRESIHPVDMRELDFYLSRTLAALEDVLRAEAKSRRTGDPGGQAAREARRNLFPRGLRDITGLPFVEKAEAVRGLLERGAEPDTQATLNLLGSSRFLQRIAEAHTSYEEMLRRDRPTALSAEVASEADRAGRRNLRRVLVLALAHACEDTAEQIEARDRLLRPVAEQVQAVRRLRRARQAGGADIPPEEEDVGPTPRVLEPEEQDLRRAG